MTDSRVLQSFSSFHNDDVDSMHAMEDEDEDSGFVWQLDDWSDTEEQQTPMNAAVDACTELKPLNKEHQMMWDNCTPSGIKAARKRCEMFLAEEARMKSECLSSKKPKGKRVAGKLQFCKPSQNHKRQRR